MPKFRKEAKEQKRKPKREAQFASHTNGTVTGIFPSGCFVRLDDEDFSRMCRYRRSKLENLPETSRERSLVAVGDRVMVEKMSGDEGLVVGRAQRKNLLSRPSPGREDQVTHVIAANIDLVCIVASAQDPTFVPGIVDRFWTACRSEGIPTVLVVNKIDLLGEGDWKNYPDVGLKTFEVSLKDQSGDMEALRSELNAKRVVLCGHSGVGKTSLLNFLRDDETEITGSVNEHTGKGTHTTTGASLYVGPSGSEWIDTPGVRSFALRSVDPSSLREYFPELDEASCAERGCEHGRDSDSCEAKEMFRYPSYLRLLESLERGEG